MLVNLYLQIVLWSALNIISHNFIGGTVDITVHEVQAKGYLKELFKASGGNWGGTYIDKAVRCV